MKRTGNRRLPEIVLTLGLVAGLPLRGAARAPGHAAGSPSPEAAVERLEAGNGRFVSGRLEPQG